MLSFSIIHKEVTTTLLQQFLDEFQNAFRDSEQRLSLSVMNNPLATKGLSLLLHVWRFSDTGCDHITHRNSRRHARELFSECLVHLANRILKPGGGCIFGGTLPGGSLGKSLQVTPLCHSNKAMWPVGPMCVKLCCSQCGNVTSFGLPENRRQAGDATALLPCQGTTKVSNPTFTAQPE